MFSFAFDSGRRRSKKQLADLTWVNSWQSFGIRKSQPLNRTQYSASSFSQSPSVCRDSIFSERGEIHDIHWGQP
jgi:hypothetical protein